MSVSRYVDGISEYGSCSADDNGKFVFIGLGPGKWTFFATPRVQGLQTVQKELDVPASGRLEGLEIELPAR